MQPEQKESLSRQQPDQDEEECQNGPEIVIHEANEP